MSLINKINDKSAKIGVIGLGYVGLPLAVEFANAGYETLGIDIDDSKVKSINDGENYIKDINDNLLKNLVKKTLLSATSDYSKVENLDCVSICVPTPLNKEKNPDLIIREIVLPKVIETLESEELFFEANYEDEKDLRELLDLSNKNLLNTNVNSWEKVLPLYPISPIN